VLVWLATDRAGECDLSLVKPEGERDQIVGAVLARDIGGAVYQANRVVLIAGKPGSHSYLRMSDKTRHRSSRAIPAPTGIAFSVGARLARELGGAVYQRDRVIVLREQARLQQGSHFSVGAVLARDKAGRDWSAVRDTLIAGKVERHPGRSHKDTPRLPQNATDVCTYTVRGSPTYLPLLLSSNERVKYSWLRMFFTPTATFKSFSCGPKS